MKKLGIKSVIRKKKKSRTYKETEVVRENILKRDFEASNPNEKLSIDVSYIPSKSIKFHYLYTLIQQQNCRILFKFRTSLTTIKKAIKDKN